MKIKMDNRKKTLTLLLIFIIGICIICILCFFMYQNLTTENYSYKTFEDGYYLLGNTYYYFQTDTWYEYTENGWKDISRIENKLYEDSEDYFLSFNYQGTYEVTNFIGSGFYNN